MKRRAVLGAMAAGVGGGLLPPRGAAATDGRAAVAGAGGAGEPRAPLQRLENEHLAVTVFDDASAEIAHKATGERWSMGPVAFQEEGPIDVGHVWLRQERSIVEQYPGRFRGRREGDAIAFTVLGRRRAPVGRLTCRYRLDGAWLEVRILEVDEALPSLVFPPAIESESLVLPRNVGQWVRRPLPSRYFWTFWSHLNMRWVGGLRGEAGWLCVFDEGHADAGVLAAELSLSPGWRKSLGRWSGPRGVRYQFTAGGYVGLAKAYRAWARGRGLFRPLEEKLAASPDLRHLVGGRELGVVQCRTDRPERFVDRLQPVPEDVARTGGGLRLGLTHRDTARVLAEAKALGFARGLFLVRGWIHGGYDESHPDVWPPEPALGPVEELAALCREPGPIVTGLHDNYADIYEQSPSFPRGVVRRSNGELMAGGYWSGGQAYILDTQAGLEYARRNWPRIATLSPRAMFVDTTSATQLYESWEEGRQQTRAGDEAARRELLGFFKEQGILLGSEESADFAVPFLDWQETRHARRPGESIPLWPLVFHDALLATRYADQGTVPGGGGAADRSGGPAWLPDLLWGSFLSFGWLGSEAEWRLAKAGFESSFPVDEWHARVAAAEMVSHRYLSEDGEVERTEFANGLAVTVNFSGEPRSADGVVVPPHSHVTRG